MPHKFDSPFVTASCVVCGMHGLQCERNRQCPGVPATEVVALTEMTTAESERISNITRSFAYD